MAGFRGLHFPKSVITHVAFFCFSYAVSCRDPEKIMAGRGGEVGYVTLNRQIV
ncbi:hypothetical protein [Rhodobacter sp. 24-YEA-8]|uniref:hypothetical protein n=1 Tax=Rhodobacter sp. 24-YEA-8 TaxID=1884310 RepID=UPI00149613B0|nr:hypothetical protein [Rhodobacter sp. 24-YEA-8]